MCMIKTYDQAKAFLEQFIPTPQTAHIDMQLVRIEKLCSLLGNPHTKYPIIHVAGTSGKGSTATFAATILKEAGLKVGLHTSPHLELVTERMQINSHPIPIPQFISLLNEYISIYQDIDTKSNLGNPSYFEILVALSFAHFAKEQVDAAVIEVGLGGKLDATNVITSSVAILTNISLDHTNILGKTVYSILKDKMGIIKKGAPAVVSSITQPKLQKILIKHCRKLKVPLHLLNKDFPLRKERLSLPGEFQLQNFSLAVKACELFIKKYFPAKMKLHGLTPVASSVSSASEIRRSNNPPSPRLRRVIRIHPRFYTRGLLRRRIKSLPLAYKKAARSTFIPGRLEIIQRNPLIILDGAHNKAKMSALVSSIKKIYPNQHFITVIAVKQGKPAKTLIKLLEPITAYFVCTSFSMPTDTGLMTSNQASFLASLTLKPTSVKNDSLRALVQAVNLGRKENLPILITGSLYLVGELRVRAQSL